MFPALFRRNFDESRDPLAAQNALRIGIFSTWTPVLTFATPGDVSVSYTDRVGGLVTIGKIQILNFDIRTSSFTHGSASGALGITGLPAALTSGAGLRHFGHLGTWGGITKAGYTQIGIQLTPTTPNLVNFVASGSGVAPSAVVATDTPSGGTVALRGQIIYLS